MSDTLTVRINREGLHSLEVPAAFETSGSFDVALENYGEGLHVHLHLDDALSEVATLVANNHYVEGETSRSVGVEVDDDAATPLRGNLKVVIAYGAETRYVDVELVDGTGGDDGVEIDESLGKPPAPTEGLDSREPASSGTELGILLLGMVALVVALVSVLVLDSRAVLLGSLAVLGGVFVAMFMLFREA